MVVVLTGRDGPRAAGALGAAPAALCLTAASGDGFNPFEWVPGATFWTWIIFLGALPLMWKFVFGPITKALEARDNRVEDAIRAAHDARRAAEDQVKAARAELEKARQQAQRMVDEATARAESQAQSAITRAKEEGDRQLRKARDEIEAEKRKALLELRQEVVDLTVRSAGRLLQRDVDDEAHRRIVRDFLTAAGDRRS
jgi:F-type H+-transporting ATPase subunit b